jgi:hypothetical protein
VGIAIGIVPHTGWAWLVRVSGSRDAPRVESRASVAVCDVLDGQLYHLAAGRTRDQAGFVERRRAAAVAQACRALDPHRVDGRAAVVLGRQLALPPLERILGAHPLIHGAEGELWRAIFAEACLARGVPVTRALAKDVRGALASAARQPAIAAFLAEGKRGVGAPWGREPQDAALAAWGVLLAGVRPPVAEQPAGPGKAKAHRRQVSSSLPRSA